MSLLAWTAHLWENMEGRLGHEMKLGADVELGCSINFLEEIALAVKKLVISFDVKASQQLKTVQVSSMSLKDVERTLNLKFDGNDDKPKCILPISFPAIPGKGFIRGIMEIIELTQYSRSPRTD
jgi:hypothetical protein